jgi:uncharacterized YigZ family protein
MNSEAPDSYLTLQTPCTHEIKIKGSRFIALGFPAGDEDAALEILNGIRKKEYNATHHCYAYVVGIENEKFKYSDDGEPSGTAGRPIYQAITGKKLRNVIVIVVRYFGGVKLGTGGLTHAYGQAAAELLDKADIVEMLICDRVSFSIPFTLFDRVQRIIHDGKYKIVGQTFSDEVALELDIRKSQTASFAAQIKELTGGRLDVTRKN